MAFPHRLRAQASVLLRLLLVAMSCAATGVSKALSNSLARSGWPSIEIVDHRPQFEPGQKTRDIAAERAGFESGKQYERAKTVIDHGAPEFAEAVDRGEDPPARLPNWRNFRQPTSLPSSLISCPFYWSVISPLEWAKLQGPVALLSDGVQAHAPASTLASPPCIGTRE